MCGITGLFCFGHGRIEDNGQTAAAMRAMAARGPDGEGLRILPGVSLGHRRLAVIDVAGGAQPFVHAATGVAIVFNGEIYNFIDLRRILQKLGHELRTQSDTEVLLHSYLEWGHGCLARIEGMFAFAVHDPRDSSIFLARDHAGIKPVYYSVIDGTLFFASTCSALRSYSPVSNALDIEAVSHYLTTVRHSFGRRTLFRDIRTLKPGEFLIVRSGDSSPQVNRWWQLPVTSTEARTHIDEEEARSGIRELMTRSVQQQLISDVPLGGFLSGGMDSSVLASIACGITGNRYHAYSTGYDRKGYEEWQYVHDACKFHGMTCREVHLDETEFPDTACHLIRSKGLPLSTPNEVAIYELARALKNDYTVAISGEGADEIFGGYSLACGAAFDYDRARRTPMTPDETPTMLDRALMRMYQRPHFFCRTDHYLLTHSWIPFGLKRSILSDAAWDRLDGDSAIFNSYEEHFARLEKCSTLDAYLHMHAALNLESLLTRVDSSTMAASVEARVPFTDRRVMEFAFGLPDHMKLSWRNKQARHEAESLNAADIEKRQLLISKAILRSAFEDRVPASILKRPKMSFPVPFAEWFAGWMKPVLNTWIEESGLIGPIFRKETVARLLESADQPASSLALWPVANLCLWQTSCGAKAVW